MRDLTQHWTSPEWRADIEGWAHNVLEAHGERVLRVREGRVRPWSATLIFETDTGTRWCKENHPGGASEMPIILAMLQHSPDHTLDPIAVDAELHRVLTPHVGDTLSVATGRDPRSAIPLIAAWGEAQRALVPHVDELLAAGAPDLRPELLPAAFDEAIQVAESAPAGHALWLDADELTEARSRRAVVATFSERLAALGLPTTLDHNDLHQGNAFDVDGSIRIWDFGDAVVGSPLASARVPLKNAERERGSTALLQQLREAAIAPWQEYAPRAALLDGLDAACALGGIARFTAWRRFTEDAPVELVAPFRDYVREQLTKIGRPLTELQWA